MVIFLEGKGAVVGIGLEEAGGAGGLFIVCMVVSWTDEEGAGAGAEVSITLVSGLALEGAGAAGALEVGV